MKTSTYDETQWKLVPVTATKEMFDAAWYKTPDEEDLNEVWQAMVAAAPEAPPSVSEPKSNSGIRDSEITGFDECKRLASEAIDSAERAGNRYASGMTIRQAADARANLMIAIDRLAAIASTKKETP